MPRHRFHGLRGDAYVKAYKRFLVDEGDRND